MERPRARNQGGQLPSHAAASPRVAKGREPSELHVTLLRLESPRVAGARGGAGGGGGREWESEALSTDMKLVRDFQARRRHHNSRLLPQFSGGGSTPGRERSLLELGLHGKQCLGPELTSSARSQAPDKQVENTTEGETHREQDSRSASTLPPISPRLLRGDNSLRHPSFLPTDFGFNTVRTDTFSGLRGRSRPSAEEDSDSVAKAVERTAQRHIAACTSLGSLRRSCRTAESILTLKRTIGLGLKGPQRDQGSPRGQGHSGAAEPIRRQPTVPHLMVKRNDLHRCRAEQRERVLPKLSGNSLQVIFMQNKVKS